MTEEIKAISLENVVSNIPLNIYNPISQEIEDKSIQDFRWKRLVLFFYPADFTFVCPTELKDLNKSYEEIKKSNAEILVASTDTVFSHKRRIETEKLLENFQIGMISDRNSELSKLFGVLNPASGNAARGTFIISPEGVVKSIEIVTEPLGRSSNELIRKLNALEFIREHPGEACPASWNVWSQTLKPSIQIAWNVADQLN